MKNKILAYFKSGLIYALMSSINVILLPGIAIVFRFLKKLLFFFNDPAFLWMPPYETLIKFLKLSIAMFFVGFFFGILVEIYENHRQKQYYKIKDMPKKSLWK
jgi:hypothetical protein